MTWGQLLGALLLKPTCVLASGLAITVLARRAPAATRHAVWTAAVVVLLALPFLVAVLPRLELNVLDAGARRITRLAEAARTTPRDVEFVTVRADDSLVQVPRLRPADGPGHGLQLLPLALAGWLVGAAVLMLRRVNAELRAHQSAARASAASSRIRSLAVQAQLRTGASGVDIRTSTEVRSPAVVGLIRPVVLIPESTDAYSDADLEAILLHEIAHTSRRDCLVNLVADLAASLYWANPLVRIAAARLRLESERACDETVIRCGADAGGYADLLLRVTRADRGLFTLAPAASAMSRARELEFRIRALMREPARRFSRASSVCAVVTGIGLALPSAALTVSNAAPSVPQLVAPEPDRSGDSLTDPRSELVPLVIDERTLAMLVRDVLAGPDSAIAMPFIGALHHVPRHENDFVRERATWVLSRVTKGTLAEPLRAALDDHDWRVQAYAAWALGVVPDRRTVSRLLSLTTHPVWRLRAMAVSALADSRDPRAATPMRSSLDDPAWQVRSQAVEYFASVGGPDARDLLRPHLDDRHAAVRAAVRRALGDTRP